MNTFTNNTFEFFEFKPVFGIPKGGQIIIVTFCYLLMTFGYYLSVRATGKMDGYSPGVSLLFVPIYEELLFRGIVLKYLERLYGFWNAIIISSVLFGLWHFKNIFWLDTSALMQQMAYTGLLFGPIVAWITLKTRTVWPAVFIHYMNNMPYEYLFNIK